MPTEETYIERLEYLRNVVYVHSAMEPVELDTGVVRSFHMGVWNCGSSACALGSYALTPVGKRYFEWNEAQTEPLLREGGKWERSSPVNSAAVHFGLSEDKAGWLFLPISDDAPESPEDIVERIDEVIREKTAKLEENQS